MGARRRAIGEVGEGNRKDIRNAVEAARTLRRRLGARERAQPRADPVLHRARIFRCALGGIRGAHSSK